MCETGPPIFWLNGSAGTGKTTIAFTAAEMFKQKGILGASFFCSRDDATCSNHRLIFPSIAYQLARTHTQFARRLANIIKKRPEIAHADVAYQLQELILDPLSKMPEFASRCIVVIDALDECKDKSTISIILAALSRFVERLPPLKIFLTSRPEHSINVGFRQSGLQSTTHKLVLHEIELPAVEADIKNYLANQLELVRKRHGIQELWPSVTEIDLLSRRSCGLFIYAATSIKFISDPKYNDPCGQLERIISNARPMMDDTLDPQHQLDQLYLQVLTNSHPGASLALAERFKTIVGTVILLQEPLSLRSIQVLLKAELGNGAKREYQKNINMRSPSLNLLSDCERFIRALFPVISVSCAHIYDSALLFAPEHSVLRNFYLARLPKVHVWNRPRHWDACLCTMEGHAGDVNSVAFSPDGSRVLSGSSDGTIRLWDSVSGVQLNVLESPRERRDVISAVFSPDGTSILSSEHRPDSGGSYVGLWNAVSGSHTLSLTIPGYGNVAVFSPDGSTFVSGSGNGIGQWEVINYASVKSLGNLFEGFSPSSIALSRNGTIIVGCEYHGNVVHIWDTAARTHLRIKAVDGGTFITSVAASPDGALIACGSSFSTIGIWDALTGKSKMTLKGHSGSIRSVAFSPDGARVASASDDPNTRVWDLPSRVLLTVLTGHSCVRSVAFSPDGSCVVSGYVDGTVRVWTLVIGSDHCAHQRNISSLLPNISRLLPIRRNANDKYSKNVEERPMTDLRVSLSPDNRMLIITSRSDENINLWDATNTVITLLSRLFRRTGFAWDLDQKMERFGCGMR
ncbi:hypothetical protein HWV62_29591 [Athelia sp. TMB]|nr:hypothetical protein HWV62_29591 [Athelia sp. TMB]